MHTTKPLANPALSIMARLEAIDSQIAKIKEALAPLESERQELAVALKVLKTYSYAQPELNIRPPATIDDPIKKISLRSLMIQEFKDFAYPMTKAEVVSRVSVRRHDVNENSAASILSRLVAEGVLKKDGSNKYQLA